MANPEEILSAKITRRQALRYSVGVLGILASACVPQPSLPATPDRRNPTPTAAPSLKPTTTPVKERSTASELVKLGQELKEWKLQDGRLMADLFIEVQLTADLLQGNLDPKTILPQFKAPITFSTSTQIGAATLNERVNPQDPRKLGIYRDSELLYYSNWLARNTSVELKLGPEILSSEARFYIMVKEVSQLIYRLQYQKLYMDLLKSGGTTTFVFSNPTNIPTSETEQIANFGMAISKFERSRFGYSSLDAFIDLGSRLQTAPIGATQRLDRNKRNQSFGNPYWSQIEQNDTDFLKTRGLIEENKDIVSWAKPFVIDEDFFKLCADYLKSLGRPMLIITGN